MSLRPPRDDDFDAMLELMHRAQVESFGETSTSADDLRTWLTTPSLVPERDVRLLERDGRLAGYVDVDCSGTDRKVWWSDISVAPDADVDIVLPLLLDWLEHRAGEGRLRVWTGAGNARMIAAYRGQGFQELRHSYRMAIDLEGDVPEPRRPNGISVRPYEEGDERPVYETHVETWLDTSDPLQESFEEWRHWTTGRAAFDPSLWFLAHDGDDLAGIALCTIDPAEPDAGWVNTLAVRRPWRRRGLGEALLRHAFREFAARGLKRAKLGVDASSPTGATRLYERVGMTVYRDTLFLERAVCRG